MSDSERQAINRAEFLAPLGGRELRRHHNCTALLAQKLSIRLVKQHRQAAFMRNEHVTYSRIHTDSYLNEMFN